MAREAANQVVDGHTAFLVDLAPDPDSYPPAPYGLAVIKGIADLCLANSMPDFLMDVNFLTVVVTMHGLDDSDLVKEWNVAPGQIEIRHLTKRQDVDYVLEHRRTKPILPVINKPAGYGLMAQLVSRWVREGVGA